MVEQAVMFREIQSRVNNGCGYLEASREIRRIIDAAKRSEESPLGLKLTRTPSFLELLESRLSQSRSSSPAASETKSPKKRKGNSSSSSTSLETSEANQSAESGSKRKKEEMKAGNLNAKLLKIGTWERQSRRELDIVAKWYYGKKRLVWEMLDNGLKKKIDFEWSHIVGIRAAFPKNQKAVLDIELKCPPLFFQEINPQPRKHTLWEKTDDFTNNQASLCRRHRMVFEEGTLRPHYEKMLECDERLLRLSREPFGLYCSPYFYMNLSGHGYYVDYDRPQMPFSVSHVLPQYAQQPIQAPFQHLQMSEPQVMPTVGSHAEFGSPNSVMDLSMAEDHDARYQQNLIMQMQMQMQNKGFQPPPPQYAQPLSAVMPFPTDSLNSQLRVLSNHMLNTPDVTAGYPNDELLRARMNSMANLLVPPQDQGVTDNAVPGEGEYNTGSDSGSAASIVGSTDDSEGLFPEESMDWSSINPLMDLHQPLMVPSLYAAEEFAGNGMTRWVQQ